MNTPRCLSILLLAVIAEAGNLSAAEAGKLHHGSPEFERMKALAGTWKGTVDMGQGVKPMKVEYRIVSGGSVIEERLFAGTPKEMVTRLRVVPFGWKKKTLAPPTLTFVCILSLLALVMLESTAGEVVAP